MDRDVLSNPVGSEHGETPPSRAVPEHAIEELLADGVHDGGLQIPRGNAKSTLWAAVGLWALCDHADAPQIPLVSYNALQARRTLFAPLVVMVKSNPELDARLVVYTSNERRVWSAWNEGELLPLPADVERLQGLNPTLALVDESQTIAPEIAYTVAQGAGKRPDSLVLTIGTPAPTPEARASALFDRRERAGRVSSPMDRVRRGRGMPARRSGSVEKGEPRARRGDPLRRRAGE